MTPILGCWKDENNSVGMTNPFSGTAGSNEDFRSWRVNPESFEIQPRPTGRRDTNRKRTTALTLGLALLALIAALLYFGSAWLPEQEYRSFPSPDGRHRIVVYRQTMLPSVMPGQSGDAPGTLRLYDDRGRVLNEARVEMDQLVDRVDWEEQRVAEWELPGDQQGAAAKGRNDPLPFGGKIGARELLSLPLVFGLRLFARDKRADETATRAFELVVLLGGTTMPLEAGAEGVSKAAPSALPSSAGTRRERPAASRDRLAAPVR